MSVEKPRRLGRGLEALIPGAAAIATPVSSPSSDYQRLAIASIRPNPYQPRREFKEADLAELQASLKASGLLQPISVRRAADGYELISGERRLRAATRLGWPDIPAIVRDVDDRTLLTLALVENLQRADLNPVEEARGYRRLAEEFGFTHQQVADAVGKDRTSVTQMLRILQLPSVILEIVEQGRLSAGHARALAAIDDERRALALANEAVARELSVRELERRVRELLQTSGRGAAPGGAPASGSPRQTSPTNPPVVRRMEDELRKRLQTDVKIRLTGAERGAVEVSFYSADDLERVLDVILGGQRDR